jgi:hypothetical protein
MGNSTRITDNVTKYMAQKQNAEDLINFSGLSIFLTGRTDVVRKNRVQKRHKEKVKELITLIEYWLNKTSNEAK